MAASLQRARIIAAAEVPLSGVVSDRPAVRAARAIKAALDRAGLPIDVLDGFVAEAVTMPAVGALGELESQLRGCRLRFNAYVGAGGSGSAAAADIAAMAVATARARCIACVYVAPTVDDVRSAAASDPWQQAFEVPAGYYGQAAQFAMVAQRYLACHQLPPDVLSNVVLASRTWAAGHPTAVRGAGPDPDEYWTSPMVASPLRRADCCVSSGGAAAYLVASEDLARSASSPLVEIAACVRRGGKHPLAAALARADVATGLASTAPEALADADVGIGDVDLLMLYDAFSILPVIQVEELGLARPGEGWKVFAGPDPPAINTDGGMLSHSYLAGMGHIVEAIDQLQGRPRGPQAVVAEVALVSGYTAWEHTSLVLRRSS